MFCVAATVRWRISRFARCAGACLLLLATVLVWQLPVLAAAARPDFLASVPPTVRGSVEQVSVTGLAPGVRVALLDASGTAVAAATADDFGSYLFRRVPPGEGYTVVAETGGGAPLELGPVTVMSPDTPPDASLFEQTLTPGYGYLQVRDGTLLAYQLLLPDPAVWGTGPYPVVIDYSGYEPSYRIYDGLDQAFLNLGYAVMGVNMRGTACSGGAFDYFEWLQALDGYDIVEVVARQPWADGVALVGKSYPGISQLFVAATRPPSLRAIVPGHVVGDYYRDVVYPGGIQNIAYAVQWATRQEAIAAYPSAYPWVQERIAAGDEVCAANQALRLQNVGLVDRLNANRFDSPFWQERAPWEFVERITVPTLLVNAWQDDTTGGRPAVLLERFHPDTPVRFIGTNGDHGEYYGPAVFAAIARFLSYYLKREIPPEDRGRFATFEEALAAYEAEDPIKIYWEMGAGGDRTPAFASTYAAWPIPETEVFSLYFQPGGGLAPHLPSGVAEATSYRYDPGSKPLLLDARAGWLPPAEGTAAVFISDPLTEDLVFLGSAAVELWLASDASDTDVEVVLSEIRPDGQEMFVQMGWLRASHRAEDPRLSTLLRPYHTHREEDVRPLVPGQYALLRVELFPFGHIFRAGSRIKVSVEAPGGNRERWAFGTIQQPAVNRIAHTPAMPSRILLPRIPGFERVPPLAQCGLVRKQPCR